MVSVDNGFIKHVHEKERAIVREMCIGSRKQTKQVWMEEVDGDHRSLKKLPRQWRKRKGLCGQPGCQEWGEIESGERGVQSKVRSI
jgi:hypothetical protein